MHAAASPLRPITRSLGRQPGWRLALQFARMAQAQALRRAARLLGFRRPAVVDERALRLPDSALCRISTEHVAAVSPAFLLNHGVRSYLFGAALGRRDGRRFDPELLYLSCVMHDLGLVPAHDGPDDFELVGARAARTFLLRNHVPQHRADVVHEAIALHARIGEAARAGPEAALTHLGAGMDVIGVRAEDFRPDAVEAVVAVWPRLGFKTCFAALVREQARRKPHSNIAGHVRLGFAGRIAAAPFLE